MANNLSPELKSKSNSLELAKKREAELNERCTEQRARTHRRLTDTPYGPRGPKEAYTQ